MIVYRPDLDPDVSLSAIWRRAGSVLAANPATILGIAFCFSALPGLLIDWLVSLTRASAAQPASFLVHASINLVSLVIPGLCAVLAQGALMQVVAVHENGRPARLGEALTAGAQCLSPLLLLDIVSILGIAAGFSVVILGITLVLMWCVATPALVIERIGVRASLTRSRELTEGVRLKILGLILTAIVVIGMTTMLSGLVVRSMITGLTADPEIAPFLLLPIVQTMTMAFLCTLVASLFLELRNREYGAAALGEIFA